ncbi:MAG: hypothetical protein O2955_10495 [Planctomycetota bacterium]|nr:hypothetical protein [Planctomycetota bacterium]MDA1212939.1 hypothetical protein [Planctomycetota bacterium]
MNRHRDFRYRRLRSIAMVMVCLLVAGCTWDRSYFQFDSNNRLPFFGLEFRWPPTAQVDRPHEETPSAIDDEATDDSANQKRRLTIRAQSQR